jgi:hypothetical protein
MHCLFALQAHLLHALLALHKVFHCLIPAHSLCLLTQLVWIAVLCTRKQASQPASQQASSRQPNSSAAWMQQTHLHVDACKARGDTRSAQMQVLLSSSGQRAASEL